MTEKESQAAKKKAALEYHSDGRPGKIEVNSTKSTFTARDLSLAYSPGVAAPCLEIAKNREDVFKYTAKGNLVAVISNGSAVLGLGNIGPEASKPVMEGKGVLFKRFADVDVFDIEIEAKSVDEMIQVVKSLEPTFGGINLEDIKAPECFEVEKKLNEIMDIPVFHDDQHGTAIITAAAFLNALELTQRKISDVKVVFSGAGAAAMAIAKIFFKLGLPPKNLQIADSKGIIYKGRKEGMNPYKEEFAIETSARTLADALKGADAFMGCSAKGVMSKEMVKSMAGNPIIFAMANPDPEILPEEVAEVRDDAIMATGRSDYPNQVNNVLGFPFIFRGALDVRAKKINEEMKIAAVMALANLAKEEVPEEVKAAYGHEDFSFGKEYLIPKPFDKRVLTRVAPAVAKAAMDSGVARIKLQDLKEYAEKLEERLGSGASFIKSIRDRLNKKQKSRIVYAKGDDPKILQAVSVVLEEERITPILLGEKERIQEAIQELGLFSLNEVEVIDPVEHKNYPTYVENYFKRRQRKGVSLVRSQDLLCQHNYFGSMMVAQGDADGFITGAGQTYVDCVKPLMRVIGTHEGHPAAGIIVLVFKNRILFLADCTMNVHPSSEDLCEIASSAANLYEKFMMKSPNVAFLSFSNFGSTDHPEARRVSKAVALMKKSRPEINIDGELQADVAVNHDILKKLFSFSSLEKAADVLIFPDLNAANIAYKLISQLADCTSLGPFLVPMNSAAHIVQRTATSSEIVNMSTVTALMAKIAKDRRAEKV